MSHIISAIVAAVSFFLIWIFGQNIIISIICAVVVYLVCFFLFNFGDEKEVKIPDANFNKTSNTQLILKAQLELRKILDIKEKIKNTEIKQLVNDISDKASKILNYISQKDDKVDDVRSFLEYYIPAAYKIINNFYMVANNDTNSKTSADFQSKVKNFLTEIDEAFSKQLTALLDDEIVDASIEMETLKGSLISEGLLKENDFDKL